MGSQSVGQGECGTQLVISMFAVQLRKFHQRCSEIKSTLKQSGEKPNKPPRISLSHSSSPSIGLRAVLFQGQAGPQEGRKMFSGL